MREPPTHVSDAELLGLARRLWAPDADHAEHLPVGFGAHHWRVEAGGRPILFATLDALGSRHTHDTLERAYAGAVALAGQGLEFVLASVPTSEGRLTAPVAGGALSAAPWYDGTTGDGPLTTPDEIAESAGFLARLHGAVPPDFLPQWAPLVPPDFADTLAATLSDPWETGPYGERARAALAEHLGEIGRWTASYHRLAELATRRPWVATHGEPHTRNQLRTATATYLVDWESLRLAPRERDFAALLDTGLGWLPDYGIDAPSWEMAELFDLEWRLDEIKQYAEWFRAPHTGTESDRVAIEGLVGELQRPDWRVPA